jgi:hypothetical protein
MRRRQFIVLFAAAVAWRPFIALAQTSTKRPLIAVLIGASQATSQRFLSGLPHGFQELGYVERLESRHRAWSVPCNSQHLGGRTL